MSLGYLDMGLLSHAEQLLAVKLASQPAVFYSTQHKINDFHSFAEKVGVKRACILVPYGKRFSFDAVHVTRYFPRQRRAAGKNAYQHNVFRALVPLHNLVRNAHDRPLGCRFV